MSSTAQPSTTRLFLSFLRLGITAFGGPAMVTHIRKLAVEEKRWLGAEIFSDGVALCQMIPGATAMQTAAYVGLKTRGVRGAAASYVGLGLPAFLLMMAFAAVYTRAHHLPAVISIFSGLRAVIVAIIANAALWFGRTTVKSLSAAAIASVAAVLFGFNVNPILVILVAGLAGLALIKPDRSGSRHSTASENGRTYTKPLLLILSAAAAGFLLLLLFDRTLFHLALLMFRIDLFAFGGAFASVPLMLHEIVGVRNWMDSQTFMNGIALGQVTPGPIVITATFVGFLLAGPLGGVIATFGIFLPSFVVLVGISPYFDRLRTSPYFNKVIGGVLCSFVGLLLAVVVRFALNVHWDPFHSLMALGALVALVALLMRMDILWVVVIGTAISVMVLA